MRLGYGKRIGEQARVEAGDQMGGCDRVQSREEDNMDHQSSNGVKRRG